MITYTLKIIAIKKETEDAFTICFKQPAFKKIKYISGQYITLIVNINNRKYRRPYSLSSSPDIDQTLNITVKRLLHGIVSNHLIDVIKEGDILEAIEPIGGFIYDQESHHNQEIFLWGAGSGITPLISILKTILYTSEQHITLIYCNKNLNQTIFHDQLKELESRDADRFKMILFFTEENHPDTKYGRINAAAVNEILENTDINNTIHYICGPAGLKATVKNKLTEKGLSKSKIFSEDFEHIVNEDEIKEIQTRFVEIIKNGQASNIEVVRGKSILEAGLDSQIDLPYSCQTGSCTLCKAKLISGQVKKIGNEMPESKLMDDEKLLCCSYPLTNNVVFEIH